MDPERQRIQEDLRGRLEGDVRCKDVYVQMYANDASIYEIRPLGVVRPRGTRDVVALMQYATENSIPVHARGSGTGLAGGCLGPGLVVDFSHSMRRTVHLDEQTVRVQAGTVLSQLNRQLAQQGRQFGPDPATSKVSTVGGVLAVDGSGSHWLQHGSARDHVVGLQVVLSDGEVLEIGRHQYRNPNATDVPVRLKSLVQRLSELMERNGKTIADGTPQSLVNASGYSLHQILADGYIDLAKLMVGSEGTLALITEATLRTVPRPKHVGVCIVLFDRLERAARAALEVRRFGISACDLMDRRLLTLARESDVRFDVLLPENAECLLLIECQGDDFSEVRDRLQQINHYLCRRKRLGIDSRLALDPVDVELYWRLPYDVVPSLYRLKGTQRALPFVEDVAVPPATLPEFLVSVQNIFKRHHVTHSLFAHAAHGQLHLRPFLDLANPDDVERMQALADDLYDAVAQVGGTPSGEHGDGLSRTWFVRKHAGPLFDVFREVKRIFDPQELLNPGKVASNLPQRVTSNLRPVAAPSGGRETAPAGPASDGPAAIPGNPETVTASTNPTMASSNPVSPLIDLQLVWTSSDDILHTTRACNGCGACRSQAATERMCPVFRFAPAEEASPRSKANLMRGILTGRLDASLLSRDSLKSIADLCVNCHQCRLECPATVDIPKLMTECKAQYVATNGLLMNDWIMTRLDLLSAWGARFRWLANWSLSNSRMRWLLEKAFGIAQGRKLPKLASRTFMRRAARRRLTRPSRRSGLKIVYFVDVYANWYDVQIGDALVNILEHNSISVYVHPAQVQSGMAMVSLGAVDRAKKVAQHNVRILVEAVRQGYQIVTTEPSAALCLKREYPNLLDDDDARLVASSTHEACEYLWKMHQQGRLELDLRPINATVGYHEPCHVRAIGGGSPGENLLKLIPGLSVRRLDRGCSGMAGTFGLKSQHYRSSLRAGWPLISAMREPMIQAGATECSACKMQMEQGTTKPTIHPLKIMALAYGIMPELETLFTRRSEELIVT
ncbi:MAG: anaerobic glycerol-3-phosphate dehydrogenase subunit C [Pirellulaceae bacterium]